jgi:predicted O-methyltransferase YrrM
MQRNADIGLFTRPSIFKGIKGFQDEEEGIRIYEMALKASRLGPCLEIGGYCGMSSLYLGTACRENNGILFIVDSY